MFERDACISLFFQKSIKEFVKQTDIIVKKILFYQRRNFDVDSKYKVFTAMVLGHGKARWIKWH